MTTFHRFVSAIALLFLAGAPTLGSAQDRSGPPQPFAHLSWMNGAVSVRHGKDGVSAAGVVDAPLTPDDHIATGAKAQADIQLDPDNVFHAGINTEVRLDLLDSGHYRMALIQGAITCHAAGSSTADVQVGTPSVGVRISKPGVYLIAVNRSGESEITVRTGDVEVTAPRGSEWVNAGQKMVARGPATDPQYKIGRAIPLWRRVVVLVGACVQIAGNLSSSIPSGGGVAQGSSGSTKTSTAPARQSAPSPPPHEGNRGKG